ncbi:MAG: hypothetical protein J6D07_06505 [Mogibacterium sp.]|nr:hypothetical protein [Mogibacterium sp.]
MAKNFMDEIKGMSREERAQYFMDNKTAILSADALDSVNGGVASNGENTNSDCPYTGNWWSSLGFICGGARQC